MTTDLRRRLAPEERREHLLRSAIALLADRPVADWSVADVARAAGVSKGLLYRYFPDLESFMAAALTRVADEMIATFPTDSTLPAEQSLAVGLDNFLDFAERYASGFVALMTRTNLPAVDAVIDEARRQQRSLILACVARLLGLPPSQATSPLLVAAVEAHHRWLETLTMRWLEHGDIDRAQIRIMAEVALPAMMDGVTRADGPQPT